MGSPLSDDDWRLASSGISEGRIGARSAREHAPAAYVASLSATAAFSAFVWPAFDEYDLDSGFFRADAEFEFRSRVAEALTLQMSLSLHPQKSLSSMIEARVLGEFMANDQVEVHRKAHIVFNRNPCAGAWLPISPPVHAAGFAWQSGTKTLSVLSVVKHRTVGAITLSLVSVEATASADATCVATASLLTRRCAIFVLVSFHPWHLRSISCTCREHRMALCACLILRTRQRPTTLNHCAWLVDFACPSASHSSVHRKLFRIPVTFKVVIGFNVCERDSGYLGTHQLHRLRLDRWCACRCECPFRVHCAEAIASSSKLRHSPRKKAQHILYKH